MKVSFYIVIFMFCFGAADVILNEAGMQGHTIAAWDEDQIDTALNASKLVEAYDPSVNPFSDIGAGLVYFWNLLKTVITSFVATLEAYKVPAVIVGTVKLVYGLAIIGLVIEFITGREFMP